VSHELKSRIKFALKIAVAAALIYFLLHTGLLKVGSLKELLNLQTVAIALILVGINLVMLNWRWYWLLKSRGFMVSFGQTFVLYLIGVFFNYALPSSVGGDVVKAYYLAREQKNRRVEAVLSVLIDRVLGLYSLLMLSLISVVWDFEFVQSNPQIRWMAFLCGVLAFVMSVCLLIGFSTRIDRALRITQTLRKIPKFHKIVEVFEAMQMFGKQRSAIFLSILVSLVAQTVSIIFFAFVGSALGAHISFPAYMFCVPIGFVAMALPIAPAGVGVGQVAFLFLFHAYAKDSGDVGASAITAFQLALLVWGLVGAIFYVRYKSPMPLNEIADAS